MVKQYNPQHALHAPLVLGSWSATFISLGKLVLLTFCRLSILSSILGLFYEIGLIVQFVIINLLVVGKYKGLKKQRKNLDDTVTFWMESLNELPLYSAHLFLFFLKMPKLFCVQSGLPRLALRYPQASQVITLGCVV